MKIVNKTSVGQRRVYDIEVEDVHNFYANGINVHNCATDGGVSVIKDDGTVVDSASTNSMTDCAFDGAGRLFYAVGSGVYYVTPADYQSGDGFGGFSTERYTSSTVPATLHTGGGPFGLTGQPAYASSAGLTIFAEDQTTPANGMVAHVTSTYNTGWMPGDIKLAALSDTDDTDLVGSGELVTNGTFDTDSDWTKGTGWTISGGVLNATAAAQNTVASQDITTVVGQTYTVTVDITVSLGTFRFYITEGATTKANTDNVGAADDGKYVLTWTATSTTATIKPYSWGASGNSGTFDNISVKLADPSRSV